MTALGTKSALTKLPLRASLAYAARCARRVQPLYAVDPEHPESPVCVAAVERAIRLAEEFAAGGGLDAAAVSRTKAETVRATKLARECLAGGRAAVDVAEAAEALIDATRGALEALTGFEPAAAAEQAATAAQAVRDLAVSADPQIETSARRDWEKLARMHLGWFPDLGESVDPSESGILGPLVGDAVARPVTPGVQPIRKMHDWPAEAKRQQADFEARREALELERSRLEIERDRLGADRDALETERARLNAERAALERERKSLEARGRGMETQPRSPADRRTPLKRPASRRERLRAARPDSGDATGHSAEAGQRELGAVPLWRRNERVEPVRLLLNPGSATETQLAELLHELSRLERDLGGCGVQFRVGSGRLVAPGYEGHLPLELSRCLPCVVEVRVVPRPAGEPAAPADPVLWARFVTSLMVVLKLDDALTDAFECGKAAPHDHPARQRTAAAVLRAVSVSAPRHEACDTPGPGGLIIDSVTRQLQRIDLLLRRLAAERNLSIELVPCVDPTPEPPGKEAETKPKSRAAWRLW